MISQKPKPAGMTTKAGDSKTKEIHLGRPSMANNYDMSSRSIVNDQNSSRSKFSAPNKATSSRGLLTKNYDSNVSKGPKDFS